MSWKPEVETLNEKGHFYGNALRFATKQEAEDNAKDLASRWMLVTAWRVTESPDPVNYRWTNDGLVKVD